MHLRGHSPVCVPEDPISAMTSGRQHGQNICYDFGCAPSTVWTLLCRDESRPTAPSPEHLAEPLVVTQRKRLFLVSECDFFFFFFTSVGGHKRPQPLKRLFLSGNKGGYIGDSVSEGMILVAFIDLRLRFIRAVTFPRSLGPDYLPAAVFSIIGGSEDGTC